MTNQSNYKKLRKNNSQIFSVPLKGSFNTHTHTQPFETLNKIKLVHQFLRGIFWCGYWLSNLRSAAAQQENPAMLASPLWAAAAVAVVAAAAALCGNNRFKKKKKKTAAFPSGRGANVSLNPVNVAAKFGKVRPQVNLLQRGNVWFFFSRWQ